MKDGLFIFDAVIHMQDTRNDNVRSSWAASIAAGIQANVSSWSSERMPGNRQVEGRANDLR